jgi:transposase
MCEETKQNSKRHGTSESCNACHAKEYKVTGKCHCYNTRDLEARAALPLPADIIAECKDKLLKAPKQHYLTLFQRHTIIVLVAQAYTINEIAEIIHCDIRTVSRWLYRSIECIDLHDKHRSGRPPLLSKWEQALIVARALDDPFVTPGMIKNELDLECSYRTIDRVLIKAGLYGRVALKSFPYTDTQRQVRMQFCNYILDSVKKDPDFLSKIFISDESSLQLGLHGNRIYVRRPRGDQYKLMDIYVWGDLTKVKSGKVKFFAGFCRRGVGKLYYYTKMNGAEMIKIIDENVIPEARRLFPDGIWYLLHDNDKKFKCYKVRDHRFNKGVVQLNDDIWPAYSPDLNPIENLWGIVSQRVFDRNPCGEDELREFLEDEWSKIEQDEIDKLIDSMIARCLQCLERQGARIDY